MPRVSGMLAGGVMVLLLVLACNPEKAVGPRSPSPDAIETAGAPLVSHIVAPQATDPAIDRALDYYYAWLDTTAQTNHKLFVYMPGTDGVPANALLVQQEAARLGYRVVGLMYPNSVAIGPACADLPDPNACSENARLEILDGIDRSSLVDVNQPNSIYNRLTKLLQYLAANYPDEGWSAFLADGKPKWLQIAVSGISQGGGEAAMIAKFNVVARVVLFSAVVDRSAASPTTPLDWELTHATPSDHYWGLAHDLDPAFDHILVGWKAFGMAAFGAAVMPEASEPPYGFTHMLVTDLRPQRGGYKNAHASTIIDFYTPLDKDGTPALAPAWRYLMSAQ